MPITKDDQLPLLPLRGILVYPTMMLHVDVVRSRSVSALQEAMAQGGRIFLAGQHDPSEEEPASEHLYKVGVIAEVKQLDKLPNGGVRALVEGRERGTITAVLEGETHVRASIKRAPKGRATKAELEAAMRQARSEFQRYVEGGEALDPNLVRSLESIEEAGVLADVLALNLPLKYADKQRFLELFHPAKRLEALAVRMRSEIEIRELEKKIHARVKRSIEKAQREYYLREQIKAIQHELGEGEAKADEIELLQQKIEESGMPASARQTALHELTRYKNTPAAAAESSIIRTYLDWLTALPWRSPAPPAIDVKKAERTLEKGHDGLEEVKERVLEYLAVRRLTGSLRGPILCLAGPPGVGKTSLARSIAEALARPFVRVSLGGVRDEAEIRGHRRTYVGAMPGRIIQGMKKAGASHPVFLLDEIDKMASGFRGDPSSAMLEVLDPEQNAAFSDHYLEEPFDLSGVLFLATANDLSAIPGPLRDRMEILQIEGYTEGEKLAIARRHLVPKQLRENGLSKSQLSLSDSALVAIIRHYTREAGVRSLERSIAAICRKAALCIVDGASKKVSVKASNLEPYIGKPKYRFGMAEKENQIGAVTGLAYTSTGGDTLQIEVALSPGTGKLHLTGQLGDVMKESAQTALSFIRSRAASFQIDPNFYEFKDIHIHVPEGATPKDGPSAGIAIATALASALTGRAVRKEVGMTGEITLRGGVLPIGGLKAKALSAHRAGLREVIIPRDNDRDLEDIPDAVRGDLQFHLVAQAEDALAIALEEPVYESA